jgi:hypothetical protein
LVVDQSGEWEIVEEVCEVLPDICIAVLPEALVVETVDLSNLAGLVVAAKDCDAPRVSNLKRNEKSDRLDGEVASIDIVTYTG